MGEISKVTDKIRIANQGQSFNFDLLTPQERLEYSHHIANVNHYSWSFLTNFLDFFFNRVGHFKTTLIFYYFSICFDRFFVEMVIFFFPKTKNIQKARLEK